MDSCNEECDNCGCINSEDSYLDCKLSRCISYVKYGKLYELSVKSETSTSLWIKNIHPFKINSHHNTQYFPIWDSDHTSTCFIRFDPDKGYGGEPGGKIKWGSQVSIRMFIKYNNFFSKPVTLIDMGLLQRDPSHKISWVLGNGDGDNKWILSPLDDKECDYILMTSEFTIKNYEAPEICSVSEHGMVLCSKKPSDISRFSVSYPDGSNNFYNARNTCENKCDNSSYTCLDGLCYPKCTEKDESNLIKCRNNLMLPNMCNMYDCSKKGKNSILLCTKDEKKCAVPVKYGQRYALKYRGYGDSGKETVPDLVFNQSGYISKIYSDAEREVTTEDVPTKCVVLRPRNSEDDGKAVKWSDDIQIEIVNCKDGSDAKTLLLTYEKSRHRGHMYRWCLEKCNEGNKNKYFRFYPTSWDAQLKSEYIDLASTFVMYNTGVAVTNSINIFFCGFAKDGNAHPITCSKGLSDFGSSIFSLEDATDGVITSNPDSHVDPDYKYKDDPVDPDDGGGGSKECRYCERQSILKKCKESTGECVQCLSESDCKDSEDCISNECVKKDKPNYSILWILVGTLGFFVFLFVGYLIYVKFS